MIQRALFYALMYFKKAHLILSSGLKAYIKYKASNTPAGFNASVAISTYRKGTLVEF